MQKIDICGIPHTIEYVDQNFEICSGSQGEIIFSKALIHVKNGMPKEITKATICHEVLHGILVQLGYLDLNDNEQFVSAVGSAIAQSFNPILYHDDKKGGKR